MGIAALALSCVSFGPVAAQTANSTNAEPGRIEKRIHKPTQVQPEPARPVLPAIPGKPRAPVEGESRFVLAGVQIDGAKVYDIAAFAPLYEPYLAKEIGAAEIQKLVTAIAAKYRGDGYFLTQVTASPQDLALGILRIKIVEGRVARVSFPGADARRQPELARYVAKIKALRPARLAEVERYMMLIDDLPGVSIDGSVKPIDKDAGTYELVLAIDQAAFDGYVSVDNRGTRAVGRYQALVNGNLNALFSARDRTGLTLFTIPATPKELAYVEITHEERIGSEGMRAWASASHSEVDAGGIFAADNLGSRSTRGGVGLSYPLVRSRDHNLSLFGKFDVVNQRQDLDDVRNFDDRLRVLRIGADYNLNDDLGGQNAVSAELSRGLDVFGASDGIYAGQSRASSRADGHAVFTKLTVSATRRQKLGDKWAVQLSVAGQKSDERLLSNEEFYIGGAQFGRAFDSGEISGDDGAAASAELQYGEFLSLPYLDSYQVYGFYDFGIVWETAATNFNGRTSLTSAGGGLRLGIAKAVFGGLEVAKPLNRIVANEGDKGPRVFFYLLSRY